MSLTVELFFGGLECKEEKVGGMLHRTGGRGLLV